MTSPFWERPMRTRGRRGKLGRRQLPVAQDARIKLLPSDTWEISFKYIESEWVLLKINLAMWNTVKSSYDYNCLQMWTQFQTTFSFVTSQFYFLRLMPIVTLNVCPTKWSLPLTHLASWLSLLQLRFKFLVLHIINSWSFLQRPIPMMPNTDVFHAVWFHLDTYFWSVVKLMDQLWSETKNIACQFQLLIRLAYNRSNVHYDK